MRRFNVKYYLKGALISTALALGVADQMARMIQGIVTKNNLMKQAIIPVNKSAGAGAEG
jgi:tripartite-type tricarboxylate transporter receptor subunit TctC